MKIYLLKSLMLLSFVLPIALSSPPGLQAADQLVEGAMILAPREEVGGIVQRIVEDTLKACLTRIPDLATAGQRMLAEQSCEDEEAMRNSAAPSSKF